MKSRTDNRPFALKLKQYWDVRRKERSLVPPIEMHEIRRRILKQFLGRRNSHTCRQPSEHARPNACG